jgi:CBS domain-containing protein
MKIKDYMTKNVITVTPATSIYDVYKLLAEKQIGGVPVVNKDKKLLGIVTKTEILNVFLPDYFDMIDDFLYIDDFGALEEELEALPVLELFIAEDIMVEDAVTIRAGASLLKAPVLMNKFGVRRLPVVDKDGYLVGIITKMDICRAFFGTVKSGSQS